MNELPFSLANDLWMDNKQSFSREHKVDVNDFILQAQLEEANNLAPDLDCIANKISDANHEAVGHPGQGEDPLFHHRQHAEVANRVFDAGIENIEITPDGRVSLTCNREFLTDILGQLNRAPRVMHKGLEAISHIGELGDAGRLVMDKILSGHNGEDCLDMSYCGSEADLEIPSYRSFRNRSEFDALDVTRIAAASIIASGDMETVFSMIQVLMNVVDYSDKTVIDGSTINDHSRTYSFMNKRQEAKESREKLAEAKRKPTLRIVK